MILTVATMTEPTITCSNTTAATTMAIHACDACMQAREHAPDCCQWLLPKWSVRHGPHQVGPGPAKREETQPPEHPPIPRARRSEAVQRWPCPVQWRCRSSHGARPQGRPQQAHPREDRCTHSPSAGPTSRIWAHAPMAHKEPTAPLDHRLGMDEAEATPMAQPHWGGRDRPESKRRARPHTQIHIKHIHIHRETEVATSNSWVFLYFQNTP